MPAAVESMFSARETPWHRLGVVTDDVLTAEEAIKTAGLDWDVTLRSMFVSLPGDKRALVPDRKGVVRTSDNSLLGIVGRNYKPFQNREAFTFADNLVDSGDAKYETAGSLESGKVVFLSMKVPQDILVGGEDLHELYILLRTSHDGKSAITICVTPIRAVCKNTVSLGLATARDRWSVHHTNRIEGRLTEARETLKLSFKYAEEFAKAGETLMGTKVTDDQFFAIMQDVMPDLPRTEDVINEMHGLLDSPTNGYKGTAWGVFNAFTEYTDHFRKVRSNEAVFRETIDFKIRSQRNALGQRLLAMA